MESTRCSACSTEAPAKPTKAGNARLPQGWKRIEGEAICQSCWKTKYILRSISLPLAGAVDLDWASLDVLLKKCWAQSTGLANWAVTELGKADVVRLPEDTKLASMPPTYLYPKARQAIPEMSSKSVVALLHIVERYYRKARLSVIWRSEASLQRFRYPVPFPVSSNAWDASLGDDNRPVVSVPLCGTRISLRLRGGQSFRRQLAVFSQIVSGKAIKCDLAIYRQAASAGDHRRGIQDRTPGGGRRQPFRVMVKMAAWVPRSADEATKKGTLEVATGATFFVKAAYPEREPWVLNADHVRRWIARHRKVLDRMSEDRKHEKRWPKRARVQMNDYVRGQVERQKRRLDTFCKQSVAMLTGLAVRLKVEELRLDDTDRSFVAEFPWFKFKQMLATKLQDNDVKLTVVDSDAESRGIAA